jgi:uncharacterized protein (DUF58 family)
MSVLPPERGERQLNKVLENLAFFDCSGNLPVMGLVESEAPSMPRASTVVLVSPTTDRLMGVAVDALLMRSMKPILVHVDAESFGGMPGGLELADTIRRRSIPVVLLRKGDDLKQALESSL